MLVSEILNNKGGDAGAVITIGPEIAMQDVATLLTEHKIGALVVHDGKRVCGIVSERDLVNQISSDGPEALRNTVSNCMTTSVVSCQRSDSIDLVMKKMTDGHFRHLPVIEDNELLGIISIGDVVKQKIQQAEREAEDLKRYIAT